MKIFIDAKRIKQVNYEIIKNQFTEFEFVGEIDSAYDAEIIMVGPEVIKKEILDKFSNLKWIQLLTAGFDSVDLDEVKKRNIIFTNAKGVYSITIAEDVLCKILMINRNVNYYLDNMKKGEWKSLNKEKEICNSTVGILGVGSIASEIAKRLKAFDAHVIGYRKNNQSEKYFDQIFTKDEGLNYVLSNSDIVIVTLPLNKFTKHLINKDKFALMRKDAIFINIARGEIVVMDDLVVALKTNTIRAAALDVTTPEPLPSNHELWKMDNVFITPHNSPSSPYLSNRLTKLLIENLTNLTNNKQLINLVVD